MGKQESVTFLMSAEDKEEFKRLSKRHGGMTAVIIRLILQFIKEEKQEREKTA